MGRRASALRRIAVASVTIAILTTISACGSSGTVDGTTDASKLDDAMEKQALAIEQRADAAALSAETEASAELERIEAEVRSAQAAGEAEAETEQ